MTYARAVEAKPSEDAAQVALALMHTAVGTTVALANAGVVQTLTSVTVALHVVDQWNGGRRC